MGLFRSRPRSRRAGVAALLAVLVACVAVLAVFDLNGAERRARSRLATQAEGAAGALQGDVATLEQALTDTARAPGLTAVLSSRVPCQLAYADLPVLGHGRLDVVAADGQVVCTSQEGAPPSSHTDAPWLATVRGSAGVIVDTGYRDPVMDTPVLVIAAPVIDSAGAFAGAAVAVHPLAPIAPGLVKAHGGAEVDFALSDRRGAVLSASPGAREGIAAASTVDPLGWKIQARLPSSSVRHDAWVSLARQAAAGVTVLLLMALSAALIRRRIVRPLIRLRKEVERAGRDLGPGTVAVEGPVEVTGLADEVNEMLAARAEHEAELTHRALHDVLTGLPNRTMLVDRLRHAHQQAERSQNPIALLFVDVDNFKLINDSLGHEAGDQVLVAVADRLVEAVRVGDTVVRFAGDEFVVICEGLATPDEAVVIAARIEAAMADPFTVAAEQVPLGVSIGVAHGGAGTTPDSLLRDADVALYHAKERGRGGHAVYDDTLRQQLAARLERQNDLSGALERHQLDVVYQPQYDLRTGAMVAVEALVRWTHPERGDIPRDWFMPIAEDSGLIVPIGDFVIEQASRQAAAWAAAGHSLRVSVNLSFRQLCRPGLAGVVAGILADARLEPGRLCFEITEQTLSHDGAATDAVERLAALGVWITVDDFGTGQLSLPRLQRLPVHELKIDRVFLHALGRSESATTLLRAMTAAAHALGLATAIDGVEQPEQLNEATHLGCHRAQGRLLGRAVPAEDIQRLVGSGMSLAEATLT